MSIEEPVLTVHNPASPNTITIKGKIKKFKIKKRDVKKYVTIYTVCGKCGKEHKWAVMLDLKRNGAVKGAIGEIKEG